MATPSSPFAFLGEIFESVSKRLQPPAWAIHEIQHRAVLFLNHVLQQEPEAQARLKRQQGQVVEVRWRSILVRVMATPAGLLDLAPEGATPDLTLSIAQENPLELAQSALLGDKPSVRIVGDVQLAAEVNWLVDHVRWDVEDDLARLIGDVPAHAIGNNARKVVAGLRQFIDKAARSGPAKTESE
jgi:ubiquinone biosynthesis accessory factor UbiJ